MARKGAKDRPADCNMMLGRWLKMERKAAGLSQALLARKIGKDRTYVAGYERGRIGLEVATYMAICRRLGCDALSGIEGLLAWSVV